MASERLKLIGTCRGGVEHIAVAAATRRKIPVLDVIRNAEPVADFTLGLIFAESRNIARSRYAFKKMVIGKKSMSKRSEGRQTSIPSFQFLCPR